MSLVLHQLIHILLPFFRYLKPPSSTPLLFLWVPFASLGLSMARRKKQRKNKFNASRDENRILRMKNEKKCFIIVVWTFQSSSGRDAREKKLNNGIFPFFLPKIFLVFGVWDEIKFDQNRACVDTRDDYYLYEGNKTFSWKWRDYEIKWKKVSLR